MSPGLLRCEVPTSDFPYSACFTMKKVRIGNRCFTHCCMNEWWSEWIGSSMRFPLLTSQTLAGFRKKSSGTFNWDGVLSLWLHQHLTWLPSPSQLNPRGKAPRLHSSSSPRDTSLSSAWGYERPSSARAVPVSSLYPALPLSRRFRIHSPILPVIRMSRDWEP